MIVINAFATQAAAASGGTPTPLAGYYYEEDYTEQSYAIPSSVTDLITLDIEASASSRTFVVWASCSWLFDSNRRMAGAVTLDGTSIVPASTSTLSRVFSCNLSSLASPYVNLSGIIVTVPGDSAPHTIGLGVVLDGTAGSVTLNCKSIRAIDLSVVTAHHSSNYTEASSGSIPGSTTNFHSVTIPGSASSRTFLVMGALGWIDATTGIRGCIRLDSTAIAPTSTGGNIGLNPDQSGSGAKHVGFEGIFVTVPGDSASHTISIAGEAQASTAAVTWTCRSICAIDVSTLTIHHNESYSAVSSGTLPSTLTDFHTVTIPASSDERVFAVDAMLAWAGGGGSTGVDATLTVDGVAALPDLATTQEKWRPPNRSADGGFHVRLSGIQLTIPGDGASHTIGIGGAYTSGSTAVTWRVRSISAVQVSA